jgi:hypothetical protein
MLQQHTFFEALQALVTGSTPGVLYLVSPGSIWWRARSLAKI